MPVEGANRRDLRWSSPSESRMRSRTSTSPSASALASAIPLPSRPIICGQLLRDSAPNSGAAAMSAGSAMSAVEPPPRLRRAIERRGRVSPEGRLIFRGRLVTFMHYDKRAKPAQGAWPGGLARRRCLSDARARQRQHQRAHHHDRREGRRPDPRQGARQRAGGVRLGQRRDDVGMSEVVALEEKRQASCLRQRSGQPIRFSRLDA